MPDVPIILIGTKIDLRDDLQTLEHLARNRQRILTRKDGENMAKKLKLQGFAEGSALTQVSPHGPAGQTRIRV